MIRIIPLTVLFVYLSLAVNAAELVSLKPYARQIGFTSFTRPLTELNLSAEISGTFTQVLVDVGDTVLADGVVAEIESTFIRLDIEANAIAQQQTRRQLELEKKTLARFENLINTQSTAQATYDEAVLKVEVLELNLKSLLNEEVRLNEQLKRHTLYAPAGWQIIERNVEPGEYVQQGQPVLRLGDFNSLIIPFLFTYEELSLLKNVADLTVYFADLNATVAAEMYRVAPDFDESRRKISVDLVIPESIVLEQPGLRGGLQALLYIDGKIEENTFRIPQTALISRYDAHWLLTPDGKQLKVIYLGTTEDGRDAVINGGNLSVDNNFIAKPESYVHE